VVQRILGHVTASLTMDLCGHLIDQNLWGAARPCCQRKLVSRVVSISLRKLLARVAVCDVNVHTDGFPFDPKD
jgi:hypothetical protein